MPPSHIILTRPKPQAEQFAAEVGNISAQFIVSPLIDIKPLDAVVPLEPAPLIFTSRNAVENYFVAGGKAAPTFCVGAQVAALAQAHGCTIVATQETIQDLLPLLDGPAYTYPRGEQITFDLATALKEVGTSVEEIILYHQVSRSFDDTTKYLIAQHHVMFPVFSLNGARILSKALKVLTVAKAEFICISATVAGPLRTIDGGVVHIAAAPTRKAMIEALVNRFIAKLP